MPKNCRAGLHWQWTYAISAALLALASARSLNEIMYHPPSTNLLEQWFEILNAGTNTVNLSGWRVTADTNSNLKLFVISGKPVIPQFDAVAGNSTA